MIDRKKHRKFTAGTLVLFLANIAGSPCLAVAEKAGTEARAKSFDEEQFLADLRAKQRAAAELLEQMPAVEPRADKILRSLDAYWASPEVTRTFQNLRTDLDQQLQTQEIAASNMDVLLAKLEVVWDKILGTLSCWADSTRCSATQDQIGEDLTIIIEDFTRESFENFQPQQRAALNQAISGMEPQLFSAVRQTQQAIQRESDEAIAELFPPWEVGETFPDLKPPAGTLPTFYSGSISTGTNGLAAAAGVVTYLLRNILAKMIPKIVAATSREVLEKATRRLIPLLGAILVAVDFANAMEAKADLESTLRQELRAQYATELSPGGLWSRSFDGAPSVRTQARSQIEQYLRSWLQYAQKSARQVVEVAMILEAPDVREYLAEARQRGLPREAIVQEFSELVQIFDTFVVVQPISTLRRMLVQEPDHQLLRFHVQKLGEDLFQIHKEGGAEFFAAARIVGIPLIYEILETPDLDWRQASVALTGLDPMATLGHKRGILFCLRHAIDTQGLAPKDLELVAELAPLAADLLGDGVRPSKVLELLLGNSPEVLEALAQEFRPLLTIVASALPARDLVAYRQEESRQNLALAHHFATEEMGWSQDDCIRSFPALQELADLSKRYGDVGLLLWQTHVGDDAGSTQRDQLQRALVLYERGFPPHLLHETANLANAERLAVLPGALGIQLFEALYPVGQLAVALVYGLVLMLGVLLLLGIWKGLRRR